LLVEYEPEPPTGAPDVVTEPSAFLRYFPCGSWQLIQDRLVAGYVPWGATALIISGT
jgi:hypothetical protein